ncbi:hypothetical protein [Leifsonia sp. 2MCAF36]|uniref:hypothetical protein n=1 Tax=Leifsonia sp. 2MCAF36 TaxID=3232988 RepID=UPI003F9A54E9
MSETPGRRPHRRVQRPGAPGSDPSPRTEPADSDAPPADSDNAPTWSSNDEQLRRDVPPHW